MSGANGNGAASGGASGGQASPNATVGSVHSKKPLGAIPPKATPKQIKQQTPKRKR